MAPEERSQTLGQGPVPSASLPESQIEIGWGAVCEEVGSTEVQGAALSPEGMRAL